MEGNKNSDAKIRAIRKYEAANYDRINVRLPKGTKEIIQASGQSINSFIVDAVMDKLAISPPRGK